MVSQNRLQESVDVLFGASAQQRIGERIDYSKTKHPNFGSKSKKKKKPKTKK